MLNIMRRTAFALLQASLPGLFIVSDEEVCLSSVDQAQAVS